MRKKLLFNTLKDEKIISMKSITTIIGLSERTIRTEISNLSKLGKKNGFAVCNIRGKGYTLQIDNITKFEKFNLKINEQSNCNNTYMQDERVNVIVEMLLLADKNITIDYIADKLGYSRSTIIKDLDFVEKKIKQINLKLERKSSKGLRIIDDEFSIRKSLSVYLYNNNNDFIIQNEKNLIIFSMVKKIFIEQIIFQEIDISNLAIENIFCHLKILILRINNKSFLDEIAEYEVLDSRFKEISEKICRCIGEELSIKIPQIEINYLASQICYKSRTVIQESEVKFRATTDIEEILKDIDEKFHTTFSEDMELKNNLVIHLCALINRARSNAQLKNPYFEEVNTRYLAVVSLVANFTDEFCKRWNLKLLKDEIAFIVIHFVTHFEKARLKRIDHIKKIAVICPRDGGIQYFLNLKIEENLKNVLIDNYSHSEVEMLKSEKYDFIITDSNLQIENSGTPIFKIKNLFDENEFGQIVDDIEKRMNSNIDSIECLDGISFRREAGGKGINYKDFIKAEATRLIKLGICKKDFADCVLKREEILSTAYKNNIAAPHGIEMNSYKNFLSTIVFDTAINWGDKEINIVFLIVMKKGNLQLHKIIANKIFTLINDINKRECMKLIKSEEEFITFFEKV